MKKPGSALRRTGLLTVKKIFKKNVISESCLTASLPGLYEPLISLLK